MRIVVGTSQLRADVGRVQTDVDDLSTAVEDSQRALFRIEEVFSIALAKVTEDLAEVAKYNENVQQSLIGIGEDAKAIRKSLAEFAEASGAD